MSLKAKRPAKLSITHARYDFLSLLPTTESLACRGRRLNDTAFQRQNPTYAPDVIMKVEVVPSDHRLLVSCIDDEPMVLLQGENRRLRLWLTNAGSKPIKEVWVVAGADDDMWLDSEDLVPNCECDKFKNFSPAIFSCFSVVPETELIESSNSLLSSRPHRLSPKGTDTSFKIPPGESVEVPAVLHAESIGKHDLCLLFIFREV